MKRKDFVHPGVCTPLSSDDGTVVSTHTLKRWLRKAKVNQKDWQTKEWTDHALMVWFADHRHLCRDIIRVLGKELKK